MEHVVLFRTIHGSRLYGLSHENSDHDYYTVVDKVRTNKKNYAKQTIVDGLDSVVVDFGTWVNYCTGGVPQALEAMFSTMAEVDHISEFRASFRVGTGVYDRYLRTIKSFAMQDDFKHKRHSLRLALNLKALRRHGKFNPTLTPVEAALISRVAELGSEAVYETAMDLAWTF